jgi:hypothetical protein
MSEETINAEVIDDGQSQVPAYLLELADKQPAELEETFFNLTKSCSAATIGEQIKYAIIEGMIDPVKAGVILKRFGKICDVIFKDKEGAQVKEIITDKTLQYMQGKQANVHGAVILSAPVHTFYKYEVCNHPELNAWTEIMELAQRKVEELRDALKDLEKNGKKEREGIPALSVSKFGINDGGVDIVIEKLPTIIYEDVIDEETGEVGKTVHVSPPHKFQKDGIKYNNL